MPATGNRHPLPKFDQLLSGSFLYSCFHPDSNSPQKTNQALEEYKQWYAKRNNPYPNRYPFDLCFQLQEAPANEVDNWHIHFGSLKQDPSLKLSLSNYWVINQKAKTGLVKHLAKTLKPICY